MTTVNPVVHLNGTGKETLLREYETAIRAIADARDALAKVTVHGRDYYPLDHGAVFGPATSAAIDEHRAHLSQLSDMEERLTEIYMAVLAQ